LPGHCAELQVDAHPGAHFAVQIAWTDDRRPDAATRAWLDRMAPHLRDALRAAERLRQLPARESLGALLLDALPHAAFLLQGDGRIVWANAAARRPAAATHWLQAAGPVLTLQAPADQRAFDAARLQALAAPAGLPVLAPLGGMRTGGAKGAAPLSARWLIRRLDAPADGPVLLAILFDPDAADPGAPALSAPALSGAFGFTPAESRVAVCMAQGCTVREIAALLGVAPSTVRSHLDAVMVKLGVARKLDAVRLLVQGGWMWRDAQAAGAWDA